MGKVGSAVLYGPVLHRVRHSVGHFIIQLPPSSMVFFSEVYTS